MLSTLPQTLNLKPQFYLDGTSRSMKPFAVVLILFCYQVLTHNSNANELDGWYQYNTKHFTVYSNHDEERTAEILSNFEIFREVVLDNLQISPKQQWVPATIYLFKNENQYERFKILRAGGYYIDSISGPTMVVGPNYKGVLRVETLYHEYVHYLMRSGSGFHYPAWYNEGIAEYFSSMDINDDRVVLGKKPVERDMVIDKALIDNIDDIMSITSTWEIESRYRRWNFYKTSWFLVHFFSHADKNGFDNYRQELTQYLSLRNQKLEHKEAFEQAFEIDVKSLKQQLRRYGSRRSLNSAKLAVPQTKFEYTVKPLNRGTTANLFAKLTFMIGKEEENKHFYSQAIAFNNQSAIAFGAFDTAKSGNMEETIALINQVKQIKDLSAEDYVLLGRSYLELANENPHIAEILIRQSIPYFESAAKLNSIPQLHFFFADVLWQVGRKQDAIDHIETLVKMMPSNTSVNLLAGGYMVKIGNQKMAKFFLSNVINWSIDDDIISEAMALLASIEKTE